jgi:hypothetical protein
MSVIERQEFLQLITKRLVGFTSIVLIALATGLYWFVDYGESGNERSYLVLLVFVSGLLGGFVSIQQRLPYIALSELKVLSSSWVSIALIPINGGIFAIVLMLMFAGNIIQGQLFPVYPDPDGFPISDAQSFLNWLKLFYPVTGVDLAKLLFWSFVAGFSERFVPQIIQRTVDESNNNNENNPNK